jgi:cytochrome c oxidase subunit 3
MSGLIKTLASKPWLHDEDFHGSPIEVRAFQLPQEKVGLRVFLAVATSLFLLFIVSYRMRMYYQDWVPLKEPALMWFNTGVLVMASVFMQLAKNAAAVESWQSCKRWFQLGGSAAAAFVGLQWLVWNQLAAAGHFVYTNPASSFFYLITAIHGIHIIGGIVAWGRCLSFADSDKQRFRMGVDLCTVYWHYLLLVWAVLFYLLLTT